MSFDISLKDPVTKETLELPIEHIMTGGTYKVNYNAETNTFTPKPLSEAWLNVTYNYSPYYHESYENGIRDLDGISGLDSIIMLENMINIIETKYKKDGNWITTQREKFRSISKKTGTVVDSSEYFDAIVHGRGNEYINEKYIDDVYEGPSYDYWEATAANAIKPLKQLITMAKLRPDGVWEVI